jgi:hypothetical protein
MTFPSEKMRSPYSVNDGAFTPRLREVYCSRCRYQTVTDLAGAKCGNCKSNLINVPKYPELMT